MEGVALCVDFIAFGVRVEDVNLLMYVHKETVRIIRKGGGAIVPGGALTKWQKEFPRIRLYKNLEMKNG